MSILKICIMRSFISIFKKNPEFISKNTSFFKFQHKYKYLFLKHLYRKVNIMDKRIVSFVIVFGPDS